jgi:hypothetical protein
MAIDSLVIAILEQSQPDDDGTFPDPSDWQFSHPGFSIRGVNMLTQEGPLAVLRTIATASTKRADLETLARTVWSNGDRPQNYGTYHTRICDHVVTIRRRLREELRLPEHHDAVPCIERGDNGVWTLRLPTWERIGVV